MQELFRNDPSTRVLLATDAAGEGVNLQNANLMVNYDLPWNPNRLEQRFGRIHRIGQTEVCHLWNMVAAETREELDGRVMALDRVLRAMQIWVPNWSKGSYWLAYWDVFGKPDQPPLYSRGDSYWWFDQAKYDKLTPEEKKAVDAISGETAARIFGRGWDKVDTRALALMQANGVVVTKADAKFVADVKAKTAPLEQAWIKSAEAKGMKNPAKVLAEFRAEIAKLEK